jgi:hypothetical protein
MNKHSSKRTTSQLSLFDSDTSITKTPSPDVRHFIDNDKRKWIHVNDLMKACYPSVANGSQRAAIMWQQLKRRIEKHGYNCIVNHYTVSGSTRLHNFIDVQTAYRAIMEVNTAEVEPLKQWLSYLGAVDELGQREPDLALSIHERRYIENQMNHGLTEAEALEALQRRHEGKRDYRELMDAVKRVCITEPNYGAVVNTEYKSLLGHIASELKDILQTNSIRDALPDTTYAYIVAAEKSVRDILRQSDRMDMEQVLNAVQFVCVPLGKHLQELSQLTGIDLLTGKRLLPSG